MSTYDLTVGSADGNFQAHLPNYMLLSRVVDFSKVKNGVTNAAAGETADIMDIPAGFVVEEVLYKIVTPSTTGSSVFGLGDTADSSYFFPNTTSATAAAGTTNKVASTATASKFKGSNATAATLMDLSTKLYSTASKVVLLIGATAPLNGTIKVFVRGYFLV